MKVTGNSYNMSGDSLFGSTSMNNLTQTVTGVSKGSSMLSDYAMIKNGSYKKLMKSYYEEVGADSSSTAKTSKSGFSVDDLKKVNKTSYEKKSSEAVSDTKDTTAKKTKTGTSFNVDDLKTVKKTTYEKKASGEVVEDKKAAEADGTVIKKDDNTADNKTSPVEQSYNDAGVGVSMGDAMNKLYNQYI